MAESTLTLVLTGARAGKTCVLRKLQFTNGQCQVKGPDKDLASLARYMGRSYAAYRPGSPELLAQQAKEAANGAGETETQPGSSNTVATADGSVQPHGAGSAEGATGVVGQPTGAPSGGTEQHASGDGHTGSGPAVQPAWENTLQQVIQALDPTNDELWTASGQPRMDAVAAACGREDVTRKEVDAALPGFLRPAH